MVPLIIVNSFFDCQTFVQVRPSIKRRMDLEWSLAASTVAGTKTSAAQNAAISQSVQPVSEYLILVFC